MAILWDSSQVDSHPWTGREPGSLRQAPEQMTTGQQAQHPNCCNTLEAKEHQRNTNPSHTLLPTSKSTAPPIHHYDTLHTKFPRIRPSTSTEKEKPA
ncbi:hypothetical protein VTJ04DRAFT_7109 [Mycothermus thermophilus]|uniref:uncharacterized protein n=1 Tax=Humicola insolens TaxID=85995 RepID=UPI003743111D